MDELEMPKMANFGGGSRDEISRFILDFQSKTVAKRLFWRAGVFFPDFGHNNIFLRILSPPDMCPCAPSTRTHVWMKERGSVKTMTIHHNTTDHVKTMTIHHNTTDHTQYDDNTSKHKSSSECNDNTS